VKLPENLRDKLKIPLGALIHDKDTSKQNLSKLIPSDLLLISVGDATTQKMIEYGLTPSIQIVDGQEKRVKRTPPEYAQSKTNLTCSNPPGEITQESIETIKKALKSEFPVRILVSGEEDLLVLPVCMLVPDGTIVLYGQPNEGLVIVKVDSAIKNKVKSILDSMT
jgi:GTP-dependent dephospho-CoA kinase